MASSRANLQITWPLFDTSPRGEPIPPDPACDVSDYAPAALELEQLQQRTVFDPDTEERAQAEALEGSRQLRESLPPQAPEWMLAARTLTNALEALISQGTADARDQAAVARTWAAWALGGASENHILRVSHLVSCTYSALRMQRHTEPSSADLKAAAGVLYQGLPLALRERMPLVRVLLVVEAIARLPDAWAAVVEGSAELLGWKHYARVHAASAIRAVMTRAGKHVI